MFHMKHTEPYLTMTNISFGYPRSDTCKTCDKITADKPKITLELSKIKQEDKVAALNREIKTLETKHTVHSRRQQTF